MGSGRAKCLSASVHRVKERESVCSARRVVVSVPVSRVRGAAVGAGGRAVPVSRLRTKRFARKRTSARVSAATRSAPAAGGRGSGPSMVCVVRRRPRGITQPCASCGSRRVLPQARPGSSRSRRAPPKAACGARSAPMTSFTRRRSDRTRGRDAARARGHAGPRGGGGCTDVAAGRLARPQRRHVSADGGAAGVPAAAAAFLQGERHRYLDPRPPQQPRDCARCRRVHSGTHVCAGPGGEVGLPCCGHAQGGSWDARRGGAPLHPNDAGGAAPRRHTRSSSAMATARTWAPPPAFWKSSPTSCRCVPRRLPRTAERAAELTAAASPSVGRRRAR